MGERPTRLIFGIHSGFVGKVRPLVLAVVNQYLAASLRFQTPFAALVPCLTGFRALPVWTDAPCHEVHVARIVHRRRHFVQYGGAGSLWHQHDNGGDRRDTKAGVNATRQALPERLGG